MSNKRGAIHFIPLILLAVLCLIVLNVNFDTGRSLTSVKASDATIAANTDGKNSSEFLRQTAYAMIDTHGQIMKMQVDLALNAWDSLTPDQKQQLRGHVLKTIEKGIGQSRIMIDDLNKTAANRGYENKDTNH